MLQERFMKTASTHYRLKRLALALLLGLPIASAPLRADDNSTAMTGDFLLDKTTLDETILDEIIVTAQKRSENLQRVPISIGAFNRAGLEAYRIDEIEDLASNVPNLFVNHFNADSTTARLFVRGIGQNDVQLTQDPSIALYVDGVYVGTSIGSGFENIDLERIEILRGPQGTLYGRNATGAAVNLISRRPTLEAFQFKQTATAGNFDQIKSLSQINLPLNKRAAAKIAYLRSQRDGVVENLGPGEDFGSEDRENIRFQLRLVTSPDTTVDYSYDQIHTDDSQRLSQVTQSDGLTQLLTDPNDPNSLISLPNAMRGITTGGISATRLDKTTSLRPIGSNRVRIEGHTLTVSSDLSDQLSLKSISSKRHLDSLNRDDALPSYAVDFGLYAPTDPNNPVSSGAGAANLLQSQVDFEQISQEFQLLGSRADGQLDYLIGSYFYRDKSHQDRAGSMALGMARLIDTTTARNTSYALFAQSHYSPDALDGRWHFSLGGRFSWDNRQAFRHNLNSASFATSAPTGAHYDKDFSNFTPSLTVAFDLNDDTLLYASATSGYKSGGTSQRSASLNLFQQGFAEEDVLSYELGLKSDFFDRRLRSNIALFYANYDALQLSVQSGNTPGDRDFISLDGSRVRGLEMDITALLNKQLKATLKYGYQDSEVGQDSMLDPIISTPGQLIYLTRQLPYAPENSLSAALDYERPLRNSTFKAHLSYSYQSRANTSINRADNVVIDSRGLIDAQLALSDIELLQLDGTLSVSLWGKNLADKAYALTSLSSFSYVDADRVTAFGDPRSYGISVSYQYQ